MDIVPFTSVGILAFGDSRAATREMLASKFSTFRKNAGDSETDSFDDLGLHLYYDEKDELEFVEAFDPAEINLRGVCFLGRDLNAVISDMNLLGFSPTVRDVGVDIERAGIALYAPCGVVEGIAVHREGYYDEVR